TVFADYVTVAKVLWGIFNPEENIVLGTGTLSPLENIDDLIHYTKLHVTFPDNYHVCGNMACKFYMEKSRVVLTYKTILEDELFPYPPKVYVPRETGWLVVERISDNMCLIKNHSRGNIPCISRRGPIDDESSGLSFAALGELVVNGYRGNRMLLRDYIENKLRQSIPQEQQPPNGLFFYPDTRFSLDEDIKPKPKRRRRTHNQELELLRAKADEYSMQLAALADRKDVNTIFASPWESLSRRQAEERRLSELDNTRLRLAAQEQLKTIESLLRIVRRRPKLMDVSYIEDWKLQKLPADREKRRAALHAILNADYERLESILIAERLYDNDTSRNFTDTNVKYDESLHQLQLTCSMNCTVFADYVTVAKVLWGLYYPKEDIVLGTGTLRSIERVDDEIHYTNLHLSFPDNIHVCGNMACKLYMGNSRVVLTYKTILEDELYPYPPQVYVPRETGWLVVERISDNVCVVKNHSRGNIPCISRRGSIDDESSELSFAALGELVMNGYRGNLMLLKAQVENNLRQIIPKELQPSSGSFFAPDSTSLSAITP
ncbi:hypothetical protein THRCLA_01902, partial [Thraustotheca clavata]